MPNPTSLAGMILRNGFAAFAGLCMLAGCSAQPTAQVESPNIQACASFKDILALVETWEDTDWSETRLPVQIEAWDAIGAQADAVGLSAEGQVQERILALTAKWSDFDFFGGKALAQSLANSAGNTEPDVAFLGESDFDDEAEGVLRACDAL